MRHRACQGIQHLVEGIAQDIVDLIRQVQLGQILQREALGDKINHFLQVFSIDVHVAHKALDAAGQLRHHQGDEHTDDGKQHHIGGDHRQRPGQLLSPLAQTLGIETGKEITRAAEDKGDGKADENGTEGQQHTGTPVQHHVDLHNHHHQRYHIGDEQQQFSKHSVVQRQHSFAFIVLSQCTIIPLLRQ